MNCDIKVSVIIPIYNAYDYLRPALDSVIYQTLREIEIICIDDGSTDRSLEILKEYQKNDDRVRIVTEANAGPGLARNNGIGRARGEYIAFLDADDFYEPNFLELLYERATKDTLDIVIASCDIYNSRRAIFAKAEEGDHVDIFDGGTVCSKNEHPDYILSSTTGAAWNKMFRRSFIIDKELRFLPDVKIYEDVYFTVTALSLAERVARVPEILIHHRIHSEQARTKMLRKNYAQIPTVFVKIKEFLMKRGMYAPLFTSYLNLSSSRCFKLYNILSKDSKENFWNLMHDGLIESLGWSGREPSEFENEDVYSFVANAEMYTHDQYKKRLQRGVKEHPKKTEQSLKNFQVRKRIKNFFFGFLRKKEK